MSLKEIEKANEEELYGYIEENWPDREKILAFIVTLLESGSFYARREIENLGEEAYEKWNEGTNYEESLAEADVRLIDNLGNEMRELITAGVGLAEVSEYISTRYYATRVHDISRIIVTEKTRIEAQQVIKRGNRYIYHCVHDSRTCAECLARDGEVFYSSEADIGTNLPPMHPWCRCWVTNG